MKSVFGRCPSFLQTTAIARQISRSWANCVKSARVRSGDHMRMNTLYRVLSSLTILVALGACGGSTAPAEEAESSAKASDDSESKDDEKKDESASEDGDEKADKKDDEKDEKADAKSDKKDKKDKKDKEEEEAP